MSTYVFVVISPATTARPVVTSVSQATRPAGSSARTASRTASETWSATLSGCPSVTDSDVKRKLRAATGAEGYRRSGELLDLEERRERAFAALVVAVGEERGERANVVRHFPRHVFV